MPIISFSGNNGTGKTTIAKELENRLNAVGIEAHYIKEFDHFLLKYLHRIYSPYKGKNYNPYVGTKHDTPVSSEWHASFTKPENSFGLRVWTTLRPFVWPVAVWCDCLLEWCYYKTTARNKVIILDRYAYDHFVSFERHGWSNIFLRFFYMHFPKPDIAFLLDARATTCLERVGRRHDEKSFSEEDIKDVNAQRERYFDLGIKNDFTKREMKYINTDRNDLEESLNEVFGKLRNHYYEKQNIRDEDIFLSLVSCPYFDLERLKGIEWKLLLFDPKFNYDYILDLAVKNNVELLFCNNMMNRCKHILNKNTMVKINRMQDLCKKKQNTMAKTLKLVNSAFEKQSIEYVVFKSLPPFDFTPNDADILVSGKDYKSARNIIKLLGVKDIDLYYTNPQSKVLTKPSWNGISLNPGLILSRRIKKKMRMGDEEIEVFVPSPEDEIVIIAAHALFQHQYTTLGEQLYVMELIKNNKIDWFSIAFMTIGWNNAFFFFIDMLVQRWFIFYGENLRILTSKKIKLDMKPVRIHPFRYCRSVKNIIDNVLIRIRYNKNRALPYNPNWTLRK